MHFDPTQLSQLHTQASLCTERFSLPLRSQVWRGMAGEFQGAGTGSSIDFQDHRAYVPGDDPRHINWQAYARTGTYTMKLYREEVRPVIDIVLDVSESMFFDPVKAARTAELFYFSTISALQAGASTVIHLIMGETHHSIPIEEVTSHRWPESILAMHAKHPNLPPDLHHVPFRSNAIRLMISDLLFDTDPGILLRALSRQHGKPILLVPFLQSEVAPEWDGNYDFIDAEQKGHHPHRIEKNTLTRYQKAYVDHFAQWHAAARRFNTPLARISSDTDLLTALNEEAPKAGALVIS